MSTTITTVRERPILFSGEMVRAILDGRKTQTRRIVKPQPPAGFHGPEMGPNGLWAFVRVRKHNEWHDVKCPYGLSGDRLWVREAWTLGDGCAEPLKAGLREETERREVHYRADWGGIEDDVVWKPSIHMPRWASRITLEITDVRVERLHEINEADARAEGVLPAVYDGHETKGEARILFRELWEKINGHESWAANSFVWVIEFKRVGI
jgi:hypothetical protein